MLPPQSSRPKSKLDDAMFTITKHIWLTKWIKEVDPTLNRGEGGHCVWLYLQCAQPSSLTSIVAVVPFCSAVGGSATTRIWMTKPTYGRVCLFASSRLLARLAMKTYLEIFKKNYRILIIISTSIDYSFLNWSNLIKRRYEEKIQ